MNKSSYDGHQWHGVFNFEVNTACKFRGDRDWANNWGGNIQDFPFGKAVFDGSGADVPKGEYEILFNDLTGHYVIKEQY